MSNIYEELSEERKKLQEEGKLPDWVTTLSWQMLKEKYLHPEWPDLLSTYKRISAHAAKYTDDPKHWEDKFFDVMWNGWLSLSTPVLANMGTGKNCPVSCSGGVIGDSVFDFYDMQVETALLSKNGFGTSAYLGDIRPRGAKISGLKGGASGVLPVFKDYIQLSKDISQGNCYDETTEILTEIGWMLFKDLIYAKDNGEYIKVAQVLDNNIIEFIEPLDYISKYYSGDMIWFKDSKNIDIKVTPNHRMAYVTKTRIDHRRNEIGKYVSNKKHIINDFKIQPAQEILLSTDRYFAHSGKISMENTFSPYDAFKIAYQADGHECKFTKKACTFRFKKPRKIDRLENILNSLNIEYTKNIDKTNVTCFYVKHNIDELPKTLDWVYQRNISHEWGIDFINELLMWDGNQKNTYSSIIEKNVDIVQYVAALSGYKSRKYVDYREGNRQIQYRIVLSYGEYFGCQNIVKEMIQYSGDIYCVSVPSGKIIVRSNGHTLVCGNSRKGAWAGYIEIDHPDFYELVQYIKKFPDDANIGWNITNNFIERLDNGDLDALDRYQEAMLLKMLTGKGYFLFIDRVNEQNPPMYKDKGYTVKASNLCNEIMLSAKEDETYTCILSSMNLSKFDEWKNTDAVFVSTVFLDCVNSDFIEIAKNIKGLERAVKFAERHRALGLGVLGFATYLQDHMMSFSGMEAHYMNIEMFTHLDEESLRASKWMAQQWGEPDMCKGYGVRNTHRLTCPPTMSTSIIVGSISQGVEPFFENVYTQGSAAGDMQRINPSLLPIMKERNVYNKKTITDIINNNGSVQHVTWLNDYEKEVFRTAFETPQDAILRLASTRQRRIDQGQSVNLYFGADEEEEYISKIHKQAFKDERIKGLYYIRSKSGVKASKEACENCQG